MVATSTVYWVMVCALAFPYPVNAQVDCWNLPSACKVPRLKLRAEPVKYLIENSFSCVGQLKAQESECEEMYKNQYYLLEHPPARIHTVIHVGDKAPPIRMRLNLYSFAATQPRDSSYVLWRFGGNEEQDRTYEQFINNEIEEINSRYRDKDGKMHCKMETKRFDYKSNSTGMSPTQTNAFKRIFSRTPQPWFQADLVRVALLAMYGGIYFDLDTVFLRDLRVLGNSSFLGRWSMTNNVNNAVFGYVHKDLRTMVRILNSVLRAGDAKPMAYLSQLARSDTMKKFEIISAVVTDPVWPRLDLPHNEGFFYDNNMELAQLDHFYKGNCSYSNDLVNGCLETEHPFGCMKKYFFYGAVSYHWHSQWTVPINPLSCGAVLCKVLNVTCVNNSVASNFSN
jgi:hypothetical protein